MSGTVSINGVDLMVSDAGESDFDAQARRRGEGRGERCVEWGCRNWGGAGRFRGKLNAEEAERWPSAGRVANSGGGAGKTADPLGRAQLGKPMPPGFLVAGASLN